MQDQLYAQLREINQGKHRHDSLLSELQRTTDRIIKKELSNEQLRQEQLMMSQQFAQLKAICHKHLDQLTEIKVQLLKLRTHERLDVNKEELLHETLVEYFTKLQDTVKRLQNASSERL